MKDAKRLPVAFVGHGSPMNALADGAYARALAKLGAELPRPKAVLCVSAHWLTRGAAVTGMKSPRTIHDFGGFPEALFRVQYPAPGDPALAARVKELIPEAEIDAAEWGLDHGAWSVLKHVYPKADVPVVQFSVDFGRSARGFYELGARLRPLRDEGVLIVGSGNIVHNLRRIDWDEDAAPFDWAAAFDAWVQEKLEARDHEALLDPSRAPGGALAVPTPDHYDPLLVVLGASDAGDRLRFVFDEIQNGSIAMRSFTLG